MLENTQNADMETAENSINWLEPEELAEDNLQEDLEDLQESAQENAEIAEGTAEKPEQSKEERAKYADLDRKKTIEKQRQQIEQTQSILQAQEQVVNGFVSNLKQMGIQGNTPQEIMNNFAAQAKAYQEQAYRQEAEEKGYDAEDYLNLRAQAEKAAVMEQQMLNMQKQQQVQSKQQKLVEFMEYAESVNPKYFDDISKEEISQIANLVVNDALPKNKVLAAFAKTPQKPKDPGISHIKTISGTKDGAVNIPKNVLNDYLEMGYTRAEAEKDYRAQMKG